MLSCNKFVKGNEIKTLDDLILAESGLFVCPKNSTNAFGNYEYVIDNPLTNLKYKNKESNIDINRYKDWLINVLDTQIIYARIVEKRVPVFSEEIDNRLDDILSSFAYDYSDNEYHEEEIMEGLLKKLKEEFIITKREK